MIVLVNGSERELAPGATVADVAALLDVDAGQRGIAIAVDAQVVPRSEWQDSVVPAGARVEVVAAIQGG